MSKADNSPNGDDNADSKSKYVPKTVHDEVMGDLIKVKSDAKELRDKLKQFEDMQEEMKLKNLKDQEKWQEIASLKEREAKDLADKLERKDKLTNDYFKRSEVRTQAIKAGIRESALDDIDLLGFEGVQLETTSTGKINVLGADKFVDKLKSSKPYWFEDKKAPNVNSKTPNVNPSEPITMRDVLKLQKEGKQAEYESALRKLKQGR